MNRPYDQDEDNAPPEGIERLMPHYKPKKGPKKEEKPAPKKEEKPEEAPAPREDPDPTPPHGMPRPHMGGPQFKGYHP